MIKEYPPTCLPCFYNTGKRACEADPHLIFKWFKNVLNGNNQIATRSRDMNHVKDYGYILKKNFFYFLFFAKFLNKKLWLSCHLNDLRHRQTVRTLTTRLLQWHLYRYKFSPMNQIIELQKAIWSRPKMNLQIHT